MTTTAIAITVPFTISAQIACRLARSSASIASRRTTVPMREAGSSMRSASTGRSARTTMPATSGSNTIAATTPAACGGDTSDDHPRNRPTSATRSGTTATDRSATIAISPAGNEKTSTDCDKVDGNHRGKRRDRERDQGDLGGVWEVECMRQGDRHDRHDHEYRQKRAAQKRRPPDQILHVLGRSLEAEAEGRG